MKVLALANQKGGVGKTANVLHLAFYLSEMGKKVLFIDLDSQENASYSLRGCSINNGMTSSTFLKEEINADDFNLPEAGIFLLPGDPALIDLEKSETSDVALRFRKNLSILAAKFDYCLIDTAPSLGVRLTAAMVVSDYVLSPIELETYSMQGIKMMLQTLSNIKSYNPNMKFLGMVASKFDSRNPRQKENLKEIRMSQPTLLIEPTIGLRSSVATAIAQGVPVWEIKKSSARVAGKEMKIFTDYVFKKMEEGK